MPSSLKARRAIISALLFFSVVLISYSFHEEISKSEMAVNAVLFIIVASAISCAYYVPRAFWEIIRKR